MSQTNPKTNERRLWISVGRSRFDTNWKNRQTTWPKILDRLKTPIRTTETYAEYMAMTKADQDKTKDVGGFVGGTLEGGKRGSHTVSGRSILSFDLDDAPQHFWEDFSLLAAGYAAALYSTHKHKPAKPRFRLLVPLSRDVNADEYEAVARMLATDIGMEYMDPSTFQPSRLMYWPSCSEDAEYIFEQLDAPFLDPDEILSRYPDWRDVSLWPTSDKEARARKSLADKQKDPTEKTGVVGAFCRAYDVPAAIEKFLPDVYTPTDKEDRYTYAAGSTAAGLVIYDDGAFAFSNHGTDPAGGILCNAFDLVRIHKFGAEDEAVSGDTPMNRRPSYKTMLTFAASDPEVIREIDKEGLAEAAEDFGDDGTDPDAWRRDDKIIKRNTQTGQILKLITNCKNIFVHDPKLQGIAMNRFSGFVEIHGDPVPWEHPGTGWRDADDAQLVTYMAEEYKVEFPRQVIMDQKVIAAERHAFHPVREYLEGLSWDGVKRADALLIDYLGAEDNKYTREATARILLAAVKRIFEPGAKFDSMLVLSGPPNTGKSMLIGKLGGKWFSDNLTFEDMKDKTGAEKLPNYWILEISEMKGMKKTDVESSKAFISRQEDIYRAAYGRNTERHPRQCVFFGTVNDASGYLKDITGNRRFWPIEITGHGTKKPWQLSDDDIDQIWAEMYARYKGGERNLLLSPEAQKVAEEKQKAAMEADDREGIVQEYLETLLPDDWEKLSLQDRQDFLDGDFGAGTGVNERKTVSNIEIWCECFRRPKSAIQKKDSYEIAGILKRLGWEKSGRQWLPIYGRVRYYEKTGTSAIGEQDPDFTDDLLGDDLPF
jgi:predicted P-loop ATPase